MAWGLLRGGYLWCGQQCAPKRSRVPLSCSGVALSRVRATCDKSTCSHISSIVCIHNDSERGCLRWCQFARCLIIILDTAFLAKRCLARPPIHFHRQSCVKRSSATCKMRAVRHLDFSNDMPIEPNLGLKVSRGTMKPCVSIMALSIHRQPSTSFDYQKCSRYSIRYRKCLRQTRSSKSADDVTLQAPVDATRFMLEYARAIIIGNRSHRPIDPLPQFESIASKP